MATEQGKLTVNTCLLYDVLPILSAFEVRT